MNELKTALIIDDDFLMRGTLVEQLQLEQINPVGVDSLEEAVQVLGTRSFDLVFSEMKIIGTNSILGGLCRDAFHVVLTSFGALDGAVETVNRINAYDYLIKPFSADQVSLVLRRIRELRELQEPKDESGRSDSEVDSPDIEPRSEPVPFPSATTNLEELEKQVILQVMEETGGSRNVMAERLGISVRTLRNKLNKYRAEERLPHS